MVLLVLVSCQYNNLPYTESNILMHQAPGLLSDADDTAKTILSLNLLGRPISPDQMIAEFETKSHFQTYKAERNASFSANCNVLNALLHDPEPVKYLSQIHKTANFLCDSWWAGSLKDKWNLAPQYAMMLLTQALMNLLRLWDKEALSTLSERLVHDRIPVVLLEILVRTLESQNSNGSWGTKDSCEVTAYAVLTVASVSSFPALSSLGPQITSAITAGRKFLSLSTEKWNQPDHLWIEKVNYGSAVLSQTYCLAAMNISTSPYTWGQNVSGLAPIPMKAVAKFSQFFSRLPLFSNGPEWKLRSSLIEGYMFLPQLKRVRLDIFPRTEMAEDKYLEYIPFTWTASNIMGGHQMRADLLWEMMIISMLNYQADEYMEAVVGHHFEHDLEPIKQMIRALCKDPKDEPIPFPSTNKKRPHPDDDDASSEPATNPNNNHIMTTTPPDTDTEGPNISEIRKVLGRFTTYVLTHPATLSASLHDQRLLRHELSTFLLAHLTHVEDNTRFGRQNPSSVTHTTPFLSPSSSTYYDWVRTTSADHTSCPYSFVLYGCLVAANGKGRDAWRGVREKYVARDLCRHLAAMCRMYNDFGSVGRDREEENLNSVNFLEFHPEGLVGGGGVVGECKGVRDDDGANHGVDGEMEEERIKKDLFFVAEYEREGLKLAVGKVEGMVAEATRRAWRLFVDVTDLYGQVYVARDIASRMK